MSASVSTTTRSVPFIDKDLGQPFLGHSSRGCTFADAITQELKLAGVERAQPVIFLRREDHVNVAVLAAYHDGLALRGIEEGGETRFGIGGGYLTHESPFSFDLRDISNRDWSR
jgi:hypothetical protein